MRLAVVLMLLATLSWGVMGTGEFLLFLYFKMLLLNSGLLTGGGSIPTLFPEILQKIGKRSIHDPTLEAEENLLLSTVSQLDGNGCVLKLLCLLETKETAARTQEERVLVDVFSNKTDAVTSYNAAFVYAADLGAKTHNSVICEKYFNKCAVNEAQLSGILKKASGCDL